jgi:hypothetical protein
MTLEVTDQDLRYLATGILMLLQYAKEVSINENDDRIAQFEDLYNRLISGIAVSDDGIDYISILMSVAQTARSYESVNQIATDVLRLYQPPPSPDSSETPSPDSSPTPDSSPSL